MIASIGMVEMDTHAPGSHCAWYGDKVNGEQWVYFSAWVMEDLKCRQKRMFLCSSNFRDTKCQNKDLT